MRALVQHDVDAEVLHRAVELLLDRAGHPVDLIDEQHLALFEVREEPDQIPRPLDARPGRDRDGHFHLLSHDVGQGGLP